MPTQQRNPGRVLAPISMVAFGLAVLLIVASAGGDGDGGSSPSASKQEQKDLGVQQAEKRRQEKAERRVSKGVYVVKTGDTLGSIAESTGVTVEKLQELNPELDPQALVSGQKIKLRE